MSYRPNTIYVDGAPWYTITDEDKLWLARMIRWESSDWEDRKAQLWTIVQRFVLRGKKYEKTLAELVQNFSQPVNPKWAPGGEYCSPGGKYVADPGCAPARLERRAKMRETGWSRSQLVAELGLVEEFAQGYISNPVPRAVDWHATRLASGNTRIGDYPNVFQATPASMLWPEDKVRVAGAGPERDSTSTRMPVQMPSSWRVAAVLGVGALVGWVLLQGRR